MTSDRCNTCGSLAIDNLVEGECVACWHEKPDEISKKRIMVADSETDRVQWQEDGNEKFHLVHGYARFVSSFMLQKCRLCEESAQCDIWRPGETLLRKRELVPYYEPKPDPEGQRNPVYCLFPGSFLCVDCFFCYFEIPEEPLTICHISGNYTQINKNLSSIVKATTNCSLASGPDWQIISEGIGVQ